MGDGEIEKGPFLVREYGSGPDSLVLLHGLLGSSSNWAAVAPILAAAERPLRVLCPDARNHGRSPKAPSHSYQEMADDLIGILDERGIESCDVVGHSMGGMTAMLVAAQHPTRLRRLAVLDFAPRAYVSQNRGILEAMMALDMIGLSRGDIQNRLLESVPDQRVVKLVCTNLRRIQGPGSPWAWRLNVPALLNFVDLMSSWTPDTDFHVAAPTLFLTTQGSPYIREGDHALIHRLFGNASIDTIPGAGHWLHADAPRDVCSKLIEHLS